MGFLVGKVSIKFEEFQEIADKQKERLDD